MSDELNTARRFRLRGMRPIQAAAAAGWCVAIAGDATPDTGMPQQPSVPPSAVADSVDRVDRVVIPSAALRNATAQGRMMSVLGPRAAGLTDREIDLMDWGFAFGVAWAVARRQDPAASEELVGERALHATEAVYEAYRGSRVPAVTSPSSSPQNGRDEGPSAADPHANGHRPSDSADLRTQDELARLARQAHTP